MFTSKYRKFCTQLSTTISKESEFDKRLMTKKPKKWRFFQFMSRWRHSQNWESWGCFTNVSRALQDILLKFVYCRNRSSYENFKLKLCTCAQSMALGTRTKFQLEFLTINVISSIVYFREIILESSRNVWWNNPLTCQSELFHEKHSTSSSNQFPRGSKLPDDVSDDRSAVYDGNQY